MIGIITFAYGAPVSQDDLQAYYEHIHNGKEQSEERIGEVINQYERIGIADTLGSIVKRQAAALEHILAQHFNEDVRVYVACKHTKPFVSEVIHQMIVEGVTEIISFPIKPLYSKSGFVYYQALIKKALHELKSTIPVRHVEGWHLHPAIVDVLSDRVKTGWNWLARKQRDQSMVIFTSHSIAGSEQTHDSFERQFRELSEAIAMKAHVPSWDIAYRSAGIHLGAWSGPDIKDVLLDKQKEGYEEFILCELLSLTSNVEVYEDLGFSLETLADELGITLYRTVMLDDSYDFMLALANIVIDQMTEEPSVNK